MHRVDNDIELKRMIELINIDRNDKGKREVGCDSFQIGSVSQLFGEG